MVRPGCPPPPAACVARGAAARGRADRAGCARPLPPRLAGRRSPRNAPRGARAAPGPAPAGVALGVRAAAASRPGYQPAQLDQLCASGEVVWVGAGLDRVALYFRDDAPVLGRVASAERPEGDVHDRLREALSASAEFWFDLLETTGLEAESALPALWELVWAGEVTNDAWTPLRAGRRYGVPRPERRPRRFSRQRASAITATQGRWSLTDRLFRGAPDRRALAELLLERQGIVTRDGVRARGNPGRLRRGLRRAARARDARSLPPRLLRRGPRRRPVRARGSGRAAAGAA